jgi:hypothetical protein
MKQWRWQRRIGFLFDRWHGIARGKFGPRLKRLACEAAELEPSTKLDW